MLNEQSSWNKLKTHQKLYIISGLIFFAYLIAYINGAIIGVLALAFIIAFIWAISSQVKYHTSKKREQSK